ncbi:MAG TPA: hypothetical protein VLI45_04710 [Acidobacteriaceae bacterium]|nr:hypothetical protein [Acidobacteriaceae bacterium]
MDAAGDGWSVEEDLAMITFILLFLFAVIGIACAIIAYGANQRRRARMSGIDAVNDQHVRRPRATPKVE